MNSKFQSSGNGPTIVSYSWDRSLPFSSPEFQGRGWSGVGCASHSLQLKREMCRSSNTEIVSKAFHSCFFTRQVWNMENELILSWVVQGDHSGRTKPPVDFISKVPPGQSGAFVMKSTRGLVLPEWSPCIDITLQDITGWHITLCKTSRWHRCESCILV